MSGLDSINSIASLPVVAVRTRIPRRSSTLLSAKIFRASSSTSSTVRSTRSSSELVQPLEHALLLRPASRSPRDAGTARFRRADARGLDALDHDAARHRVEAGVLLGAQFAAGEHDHRHVRQRVVGAEFLPALQSRSCRAGADRGPRNRRAAGAAHRAPRVRCRRFRSRRRHSRAIRKCSSARPGCLQRPAGVCAAVRNIP